MGKKDKKGFQLRMHVTRKKKRHGHGGKETIFERTTGGEGVRGAFDTFAEGKQNEARGVTA